MSNVAVILSGCGVYDGAEINEEFRIEGDGNEKISRMQAAGQLG